MRSLTNREKEVLALMAQGLTNKEIAKKLFISYKTVKNHIFHIYDKLEIHTERKAIAYYYQNAKGSDFIG